MRTTESYCLKGKGNLQSLELTHLPHLRSMLQQPLNDLKQQRGEVQIFLPVIGQKISKIRILLHVMLVPTFCDTKFLRTLSLWLCSCCPSSSIKCSITSVKPLFAALSNLSSALTVLGLSWEDSSVGNTASELWIFALIK